MTPANRKFLLLTFGRVSRLATISALVTLSAGFLLGNTLVNNAQSPSEAGMAYYGREVINDYSGSNFGSTGKLVSVSFFVQADAYSKENCPTCNFYAIAYDINFQPHYTMDHVDLAVIPVGAWVKITLYFDPANTIDFGSGGKVTVVSFAMGGDANYTTRPGGYIGLTPDVIPNAYFYDGARNDGDPYYRTHDVAFELTDSLSTETHNPVILTHGWCSDPSAFGSLAGLLRSQGLTVYTFDYSAYTKPPKGQDYSIEQIGYAFGQFVDTVRATEHVSKVDVVAHSEGGLVAEAWMVGLNTDGSHSPYPYSGQIARLATIGTPHYGIGIKANGSKVDPVEWRILISLGVLSNCSEFQAAEMAYGSQFISDLHDRWQQLQTTPLALSNDSLLFVVGTNSDGFTECSGLISKGVDGLPCNDGLVDVDSAVLPSASLVGNVRYVPYTHRDDEAKITDALHKTYQTIRPWLLSGTVPLQSALGYLPPFFRDPLVNQGFLFLRLRDDRTHLPVSINKIKSITFSPSLPNQPFAFPNDAGVVITQLPPGVYDISLTFAGYEAKVVHVPVQFNLPTVPDPVMLSKK